MDSSGMNVTCGIDELPPPWGWNEKEKEDFGSITHQGLTHPGY